ncbi:MAG: hypothetical protein R3C15_02910 [Thermoleophilia bacterium]
MLFIGWTRAVRGREAAAQGVFREALGLMEQLRGEGRIESYEPVLLDAHGGDLRVLRLVRRPRDARGAPDQPELERLNARAVQIVDGYGVVGGVSGPAVAARMALAHEAAAISG